MKKILSVLLALTMILTLIPAGAAFAAEGIKEGEKFPEAFFEGGVIQAPDVAHVYLIDENDSGCSTSSELWVPVSKEMRTLGEELNGMDDADFLAKYGYHDLRFFVQCDLSVGDENHWQYKPSWDIREGELGYDCGTREVTLDVTQKKVLLDLFDLYWDMARKHLDGAIEKVGTFDHNDIYHFKKDAKVYFRIRYLIEYYDENGGGGDHYVYSDWSDAFPIGNHIQQVTGLKAKATTKTSITLTWNKSAGATGYRVYQYNASSKKWVKIKTTSESTRTYKVTKLKSGKSYKYKVVAYAAYGSHSYSAKASAVKKLTTK